MTSILRRAAVVGAASALTVAALGVPTASAAPGASPRTTVDSAPAWTAKTPAVAETPAAVSQTMSVVLNLRDAAGAEALAAAVSDPASSQYGHFVSASAWRARFAPTDATVTSVVSWLKSQGFSIGAVPANHRTIPFTGTSAQTEKAFGTDLKVFNKNGQQVSAPATPLSVPSALAGVVAGVSGLDRSSQVSPSKSKDLNGERQRANKAPDLGVVKAASTELPPPSAVFKNAGPCSAYYGEKPAPGFPQILADPLTYAPCGYKPGQLRGAYGVDTSLAQGVDGRGATVAIVDAYASPTILADAQEYAKRNDPRHPLRGYQFREVTPANYTNIEDCQAPGWYGEETLDVEAVHAMAPAANIVYVGAVSCDNNDINAAVNTIVDNELAQIISNSYGSTGEPALADTTDAHQTFVQAAAEGITVAFSSGDNGDEVANTGKRQVDYEASDPMVTAVGGTALAVGKSDNYLFEQGWGTGRSILTNGKWVPNPPAYLYGGGGGTSQLFTQPSYQKGVVPVSIANYFKQGAHRAVPDVGMLGDPNTGFLVGQSQSFPDGSIQYSEYRIGGTSLSCPLFAGTIAVANQWKGSSLGFLNPRLYKLAGTSAFRDVRVPKPRAVTDGVVRVDFVNGLDYTGGLRTSLRTLNQTESIFVRPGYDDVTGVGSPNGFSFFYGMATGRPLQTRAPRPVPSGGVLGQPSR